MKNFLDKFNKKREHIDAFLTRNIPIFIMLIVLCPVLAVSYSKFVISSSSYRSNEMYISNLLYGIEIDGNNTTSITIPANTTNEEHLIEITALDSISSNYKLTYVSNANLSIEYANDYLNSAFGGIVTTKSIEIKVTNSSSTAQTLTLAVFGGYSINEVADVIVASGYTEIEDDYDYYDYGITAIYANGTRVENLDSSKEYALTSYSCTNGGTVTFDDTTNSIVLDSNVITKCSLYFKEVLPLYKAVANQTLGTGSDLNSGAGIDFTNPSSSTNGRGVYTYTHDSTKGTIDSETGTKTIYYYRGNVTNNNVLFAGYCWLIVRTTDTGGVKLLYNGTPVSNTCPSYRTTESDIPFISTSTVWNDDTYSVLYSASNVKTVVDSWISTNLSSYSSKLETINWCNDADGQQYDDDVEEYNIEYSGNARADGGTPQLECTYNNDKYSLTGALLTIDEAMLAGQKPGSRPEGANNDSYAFVYEKEWWLLTPTYVLYMENLFDVWYDNNVSQSSGSSYLIYYSYGSSRVNDDSSVRPSIALNSSVMITDGDGSVSTPYIVD